MPVLLCARFEYGGRGEEQMVYLPRKKETICFPLR